MCREDGVSGKFGVVVEMQDLIEYST